MKMSRNEMFGLAAIASIAYLAYDAYKSKKLLKEKENIG